MKKLLLLAALCLFAAPASRVSAQTAAPETPQTSQTVTVVGAVFKPGVLPFVSGEKVTALLERAGGANAVAAVSRVYVLREGIKIPLDLSLAPEIAAKLILHEGDVLVVPENPRRIAVLGNVARPGKFALPAERNFSVVDALNAAGGTFASPDEIRIDVLRTLRTGSDTSVQEYYWPEDAKALSSRSLLQEGDVVYVSPLKKGRGSHREGVLQLLPFPLIR